MYVCLHVPNQVFLRCRTCRPYRLWYWSYRVLNQRMYRLAKAPYVVFLGWPTSFPLELGLCLDLLCMKYKGLIPFTLGDAAAGCQFLRVPLCFSLKLLPTMKRERIERWQEKGGHALVSNWEIKGEKLMVERRRNKMLRKRTEGKTVRGKERIEKTMLLTHRDSQTFLNSLDLSWERFFCTPTRLTDWLYKHQKPCRHHSKIFPLYCA